jgi:MFS family permease
MKSAIALLRTEPRARVFFIALAQSSLGTGAAYVALLLIAYERLHSPWAVSLVLLAEFAPAILLGAVLGAAADRWSRRWCAVVGDALRALAFVGIAVVDTFPATLALALVAGLGTALFRPAILAGLPSLVSIERRPAATSLYGAITDLGYTVGPALAAVLLLLVRPVDLMALNGLTFAVSALVLMAIPFGEVPTGADGHPEERTSLLRAAAAGLRATAGIPAVRLVIAGSAAGMFAGGIFNVVELPFATRELGASATAYSLLVATFGLGFVLGSLRGASGGSDAQLKRRYVQGLAVMGAGAVAAGLSPGPALAALGFTLAGFGNGLFLVHERLIFQSVVPAPLQGRVFGISDALVSWGFAAAFLAGGALGAAVDVRAVVLLTGGLGLAVAAGAAVALRRAVRPPDSAGVLAAGERVGAS